MSPQRVVLGAWLAMIGLTAARSFGAGKGWPAPSAFLASGVLFTMLYGAAGFLGPLPAVFAVGVDVAAVALPYLRGGTSGPLDTIAASLAKLTGSEPAAAPGGGQGNLTP